MDYITEIKAFYDWMEANQLKGAEISLWHALMNIANKLRWPEDFSVSISVLKIKTGFGESSIENARNKLQQKGRIRFRSRTGNQSAIYQIIPFVRDIQGQTQAQTQGQSGGQPRGQLGGNPGALNKQDKTKQNNIPPISPKGKNCFEEFAGDNAELLSALQDFEVMRNKIKKPMTDRARQLMLKQLKQLATDPKEQIAVLEQSISSSWAGVFPLRSWKKNAEKQKDSSYDLSEFDKLGYDIPEVEE